MTQEPHAETKHVVVLGAMGVGKSTTADALGAALGHRVRDSDRDIERAFAKSGRELADEFGIAFLHRLEAGMVIGALSVEEPTVIAAAASVVEDPAVRMALANRAYTVVLSAQLDVIEARAATGRHRRTMPRPELEELMARRAPLFDEVADLTLDATAALPQQLVDTICAERRKPSANPDGGGHTAGRGHR